MRNDTDEIDADSKCDAIGQSKSVKRSFSRRNAEKIAHATNVLRRDGEIGDVKELISVSLYQEYSGLLPHPQQFNHYNKEAQDLLIELAQVQFKATFVDESSRQDQLVKAEIRQSFIGQILSATIIICAILASTIVIIFTGNAVVGGIIAGLPIAAIITNLFHPVKSKSVNTNKRSTSE